jgi:DNA uptake protein ComE-like DNA-binding protein
MQTLRLPLLLALALLVSCAQLGIAPAQSFDQKLAYAEQADAAVLTASTASLRAQQISSADHEKVIAMADQAKGFIDAAKLASNPADANAKLALATAVLTQIQTYITAHKGK